VRRDGRWLSDGGIADRHGLAGMPAATGATLLYHHLASRSPWRRAGGPALRMPRRDDMVALRILGLPRVHPFRLTAGRLALVAARDATRRALELPADRLLDLQV
jgi:NTE family protein